MQIEGIKRFMHAIKKKKKRAWRNVSKSKQEYFKPKTEITYITFIGKTNWKETKRKQFINYRTDYFQILTQQLM